MPRSRSCRSRSVVDMAPTRVLRTTMSPGWGASRSWMAVDGSSWCIRRFSLTRAKIALAGGMAAQSASVNATRT